MPTTTFLTGVITKLGISMATAVIGFVIGRLWKSLLRPLIENSWYSGTRLAQWYVGELEFKGKVLNDHIEVNQRAGRVWGTMTLPSGRQGVYKFEAVIADNIIRGTFDGVRMAPHAHGSFLLIAVPGRLDLHGRFIEVFEGAVIESSYVWRPKDRQDERS